jgi:hypothetical protein
MGIGGSVRACTSASINEGVHTCCVTRKASVITLLAQKDDVRAYPVEAAAVAAANSCAFFIGSEGAPWPYGKITRIGPGGDNVEEMAPIFVTLAANFNLRFFREFP